jgi:hypothetical protein
MHKQFCLLSEYLSARFFLFLTLTVVVCFAGCSDKRRIDETKRTGNQVIQALEQFRSDRGHYPKSLSDLSPKYLRELPAPTWGVKKWQYEANKGEFTLRVDESVHTGDGDSRWLRYQGKGWGMGD